MDLDLDDDAVLTLLRAGDENTFATLVVEWTPAMVRLASRFVTSTEVAEEVVQDSWLAVLGGIDKFEGRSSLRTWVLSILIHRAQRTGRRERRSIPFSAAWRDEHAPAVDPTRFHPANAADNARGWVYPVPRWDLQPEDGAQRTELWTVLEAAISLLPRLQQQVVTTRDIWGCDATEVCELLGLSANYQRVLLHRARAKLRTAVEEYQTQGDS